MPEWHLRWQGIMAEAPADARPRERFSGIGVVPGTPGLVECTALMTASWKAGAG